MVRRQDITTVKEARLAVHDEIAEAYRRWLPGRQSISMRVHTGHAPV